jgi:murein L,D-transpeptidase YafK
MRSKSAIVLLSISLIGGAAFFLTNVMSQQNKVLPNLENPRLVVRKTARKLEVFDGDKLIKTYTVVLGFTPKGDKEIEGDGKTPEGEFYVFTKNPESKFHLSLGISYPAKDDAIRGIKRNLISAEEHDLIAKAIDEKQMPPQKTKLGGEVYIHGGGIESDWTDGCVALKNEEIEEIFAAIPAGTKVEILP